MKRPQVLLADDHRLLTDALKSMLEPECEVVGAVFDGQSLFEEVERLHPDVVVLDISMPKLNGLDAAKKLKLRKAAPKLIFMTMNEDPYLVGEAFRSGASAFLLKRGAAFELTDAIGAVLRGGTYVSPEVEAGLTAISLRSPKDRDHAPKPTARQREVIQLLAEGRSMKSVADILHITPRTVASHKYGVMALLQIKSNAELIQYAIKQGIISV
ncbi:MAG: response regulator transcription factor [Candidatus Acidiferrales bacterium]|jgi:DNA-binding NarL/FixJ family response regulator